MTDRSELNARASRARRIAFFISPHGFGHAARAAGVMEALTAIESSIQFDIFTTVPEWFFSASDSFVFQYHHLLTDIGLIQRSPFVADITATVEKLKTFLPYDHSQIAALAEKIRLLNCEMIVCDIAPLGIRIAQNAGIPSVLIENFTWDWLYEGYADDGLNAFNAYLQSIFADATYHIQTQPACKSGAVDFRAAPASRKIKTPSDKIRQQLGISESCKVLMISVGGVAKNYNFIDKLNELTDIHFIIPGAADSETIRNNLVLLPENSTYFHPDLIHAADAVVGKAGYSTIAEIYQAGAPFGYVARPDNRESQPLVDFVENHMSALAIAEPDFQSGAFTDRLQELLQMPRLGGQRPNGADQIAKFIASWL